MSASSLRPTAQKAVQKMHNLKKRLLPALTLLLAAGATLFLLLYERETFVSQRRAAGVIQIQKEEIFE